MIFTLNIALLATVLAVVPLPQKAEGPGPLEFEQVVSAFKKMTEVQPLRLHARSVVFALGELYRRDDHVESVIVVTDDAPRLSVSFLVSGGYGMNFVSEFFEAPFFTRDESEQFYGLLYGPEDHTAATFPRFAVDFTRVETPAWHFISLTFGPPAPAPLP